MQGQIRKIFIFSFSLMVILSSSSLVIAKEPKVKKEKTIDRSIVLMNDDEDNDADRSDSFTLFDMIRYRLLDGFGDVTKVNRAVKAVKNSAKKGYVIVGDRKMNLQNLLAEGKTSPVRPAQLLMAACIEKLESIYDAEKQVKKNYAGKERKKEREDELAKIDRRVCFGGKCGLKIKLKMHRFFVGLPFYLGQGIFGLKVKKYQDDLDTLSLSSALDEEEQIESADSADSVDDDVASAEKITPVVDIDDDFGDDDSDDSTNNTTAAAPVKF